MTPKDAGTINSIAAKLNINDRDKRIEAALEINELAKIIIELKRNGKTEESNSLH